MVALCREDRITDTHPHTHTLTGGNQARGAVSVYSSKATEEVLEMEMDAAC